MVTTWKIIKNHPTYEVSELGEIRNRKTKHVIKPRLSDRGYLKIQLNRKTYRVHRLVAQSFIDNPLNLPEVNHKDGDKTNNTVSNLEWVSKKENIQHSFRMGLNNRWEKHFRSRLTKEQADEIRRIYLEGKTTQKQLATVYNVHPSTISRVINNFTYKDY